MKERNNNSNRVTREDYNHALDRFIDITRQFIDERQDTVSKADIIAVGNGLKVEETPTYTVSTAYNEAIENFIAAIEAM